MFVTRSNSSALSHAAGTPGRRRSPGVRRGVGQLGRRKERSYRSLLRRRAGPYRCRHRPDRRRSQGGHAQLLRVSAGPGRHGAFPRSDGGVAGKRRHDDADEFDVSLTIVPAC